MKVVIYEDYFYLNFIPFYRFHTIYDLYYGFRKIFEKVNDLFFNDKTFEGISFIGRELQLKYFLEKYNLDNEIFDIYDDILFVNARIKDINEIKKLDINECFVDQNGDIAAFRVNKKTKHEVKAELLFNHEIDEKLIKLFNVKDTITTIIFPFEFITNLENEFQNDLKRFSPILHKRFNKYKKDVFIGKNVKIAGCVELDTSNGPIIVDDNTKINPMTAIFGPVYIGKNSIVDKAYIHENTVIGNVCKISGEIEESIFSDYTNKHHTGFLGHSYLGEWVNIGAMSTTSDLKNNYSNIKFEINGKIVDSNTNKMGSLFGDHVKVSIGIMINCGTIIQEGSVIFDKISKKSILPFRWGEQKYNKIKFIENVEKVIERRGKSLTLALKQLIENQFK